jgi:hypothetical protein
MRPLFSAASKTYWRQAKNKTMSYWDVRTASFGG